MRPFGLRVSVSAFFFFFFSRVSWSNAATVNALFTDPQIPLFRNFFIKNGFHSTIHTFKNYFTTVFSISVFSFSKNKLNPNRPNISFWRAVLHCIMLYLWRERNARCFKGCEWSMPEIKSLFFILCWI